MNDNTATLPVPPGAATHEENTSFWTWPRITLAALLGLSLIALGTLLGLYVSWKNSGLIAPGIVVQGEPLAGLSSKEAQARLEKRFGRSFISLETPQRSFKLAVKQLGGEVLVEQGVKDAYWYGRSENIVSDAWRYWSSHQSEQRRALRVKWDKDTLRSTMWTLAQQYNLKPRDAKLEVTDAGIQVIPDESGRALNIGETCKTLQAQYYAGKPAVKATVKEIAPRIVAADLAGQDVKLGQYTTYFNSGLWGRTQNIRIAADTINGKVLMPKEKFSFNTSTGERTYDKGYRIAHIFIRKPGKSESEVVDGRGGGVCQVSSTLYNAVRKANNRAGDKLDILERNHHSLPVDYVPYGLDATVAWPHKDFQFRNTYPHPVYLRTDVAGSRLTISVWGRVPDDVAKITASADQLDSGKQASTPDSSNSDTSATS